MDEYIKKSEAVDVIVKYPYNIAGKTATAIKMIEDLPSADVVPKSEGERLEYDNKLLFDEGKAWHREAELNAQRIMELEAEKDALIKNYAECMKDYASEIFAEIESKKMFLKDCVGNMGVVVLFKDISEIKKKYTEIEVEN